MALNNNIARRVLAGMVFTLLLVVTACSNSTGPEPSAASTPGGSAGGQEVAGPNESPGVTDTEIKYGSFGTVTGNPTGGCYQECFDQGVNVYFDWRNGEGGIYGRQLKLTTQLDDQLLQNQPRALELVSANDVFGAFSASPLASGWKDVAAAGIPLYVWSINFDEMNGRDSIYGNLGVQCITCLSHFAPYSGTLLKAKKVSAVGYGIAQSSKDCVTSVDASVTKYGGATGQSMAFKTDTLDFGLPNGIAAEVTAMKNAGTDMVATCISGGDIKTMAQEMKRQGLNATIASNNLYDADFIKEAGDLFEGAIVTVSYRPFEAGAGESTLDQFKQQMGKLGKPLTESAMIGWINADQAYQGLKAAGPNFTREKVIQATNAMKAFNAGGLIASPIDWSRQHVPPTDADPKTHGAAQECYSFVTVKGGKFEFTGDKDKPFMCWTDASKWTEPTPTNFK